MLPRATTDATSGRDGDPIKPPSLFKTQWRGGSSRVCDCQWTAGARRIPEDGASSLQLKRWMSLLLLAAQGFPEYLRRLPAGLERLGRRGVTNSSKASRSAFYVRHDVRRCSFPIDVE